MRWRGLLRRLSIAGILAVATLLLLPGSALALLPLPPNPQQGSIGIEGTIPSPPPTQAATITVPANGQVFTATPVTISGLCPKGLLVKIFSNNVFVGSVQCDNGSYSIRVDLFSGRNDLVARVYDTLDQAGPDSNVVSVTFNDAQFAQFGGHMLLTSSYAKRGANPGERLDWPILVSDGSPPYAVSVDWGDNKQTDLISLTQPGPFTISHVYDAAGIYQVVIKGTDKNGTSAFLQVVGVANGAAQATTTTKTNEQTVTKTKVLWAPTAISFPLIFVAFFIGQKYQLFSLRRSLERSTEHLQD